MYLTPKQTDYIKDLIRDAYMAGCTSKPLPQGLTERDVEAVRRVRADDYAHATSLLLIKLPDGDTPASAPAPHARWTLGIGITAGWEVYENAMFLLPDNIRALAPTWDDAEGIIKEKCTHVAEEIRHIAQLIDASSATSHASPTPPEKKTPNEWLATDEYK